MRNIALKLMYNGTAYHGWQVQKTVSSVCETMEKGLSKVCGGNVKLVGCGRTDAGVHAERYIANFHTESRIPVERLPFAINTHTPEDIVVREALEVAEDFNAILSCQKKEYTYRIYNSRRSARTGSCITWYGRSPARCSTPPRGSSRQRTSPRSWPPATARSPAPRCRRADCT